MFVLLIAMVTLSFDYFVQVVMFSSVEELHAHIDRDQLTEDVGGTLSYNHQEWIQHRAVSSYNQLCMCACVCVDVCM